MPLGKLLNLSEPLVSCLDNENETLGLGSIQLVLTQCWPWPSEYPQSASRSEQMIEYVEAAVTAVPEFWHAEKLSSLHTSFTKNRARVLGAQGS